MDASSRRCAYSVAKFAFGGAACTPAGGSGAACCFGDAGGVCTDTRFARLPRASGRNQDDMPGAGYEVGVPCDAYDDLCACGDTCERRSTESPTRAEREAVGPHCLTSRRRDRRADGER
jgi:hypothetical protein